MKIKTFSQNFKRTSPGSRVTLGMSLAIIAVVGLYNWSVSPQSNYLQAAQQYSRIAEDAEKQVRILGLDISRKENKLAQAKTEIVQTKARLFDRRESIDFLSSIQPLAQKLDCVVDDLTFDLNDGLFEFDNTMPVNITEKSATISLTGQYDSISKFINVLCDHPQKIVVSDVEMNITPDFSALKCNMDITIYVIQDKESDSDVEL